jgi:hypothetical protein
MSDMNLLNQILAEVLVCACSVLETGLAGEKGANCGCPCRAFVTAGSPVWDMESCCSDGQLAVYVKDIFPFRNFPVRGADPQICAPTLAANVSVQLLRCWPANIGDDGTAPTGPQIQKASEDIYRDMYLLTWGLICCLKKTARRRQFVLNGSRILGPQGACVGAEVDLVIEIIDI